MRTRVWTTTFVVLVGIVGLPAAVTFAQELAAVYPGSSPSANPDFGGASLGWEFKVGPDDIVVTALGLYLPPIHPSDGFGEVHEIKIWEQLEPEDPCAVGTIPAGIGLGDSSTAGYLYVDPNEGSATLYANKTYVIAAYWRQTLDPLISAPGDDRNVNAAITVTANGLRTYGDSLVMPTDKVGFYWSPNFKFVKDPASLLEALVAKVWEIDLQQGIATSLDAKLDAALGALQDLNENNDGSAVNKLQAFINEVEAQRLKKLTDEQADELSAAAQAIIDLLNGS